MNHLTRRDFFLFGTAAILGSAASTFGGPKPGLQSRDTGPPSTVKVGGARMIPIDGGKYHVWTKRVGRGSVKVLLLHGGPGATHEYMECFEDFLPQRGIEMYHYDQLGSGFSDRPDDPTLWTVERFREEVEQVRTTLGLEKFILLGHSWGGMLAIEYALKYQKHLRGLVISNMTASIPAYVAHVNELRRQLPADTVRILDKYEAVGQYEAPEYVETMLTQVYSRHLCRLNPWPEPVERSLKHFNNQVYNTLQGPNEFVVTGTFKNWDRWGDLPKITVPTLVVGARHDTMSTADIEKMAALIPNSRALICRNGSHMAMYDDQEFYMRHVTRFIKTLRF